NRKTLRVLVEPADGFYYCDPIPLQPRPVPAAKGNFTPDPTIGVGQGLLDVNTVYDSDRLQRMGDPVLTNSETIPRNGGKADIAKMKKPGNTEYNDRVARFFRITKAVPTPGGLSRDVIGETESEMVQILGYGVVEPDGSVRA